MGKQQELAGVQETVEAQAEAPTDSQETNKLINQLLDFSPQDRITSTTYLHYCCDEYIHSFEQQISQIVGNQEDLPELDILSDEFLVKTSISTIQEEKTLYAIMHIHSRAWALTCTDVNTITDKEKHLFSIYKILYAIVKNWDKRVQEALKIEEFCRTVALHFFRPRTIRNDPNLHAESNHDICRHMLSEQNHNLQILHQFHMPKTHKSLISIRTIPDDLDAIRERINMLEFFQNYIINTAALEKLMSCKFQAQKKYISMLNNQELKEFYDFYAGELVGNKRSSRPETAHIIQKFSMRVMEYLTIEMSARFGAEWNILYNDFIRHGQNPSTDFRRMTGPHH